jgi:hypothetical protein
MIVAMTRTDPVRTNVGSRRQKKCGQPARRARRCRKPQGGPEKRAHGGGRRDPQARQHQEHRAGALHKPPGLDPLHKPPGHRPLPRRLRGSLLRRAVGGGDHRCGAGRLGRRRGGHSGSVEQKATPRPGEGRVEDPRGRHTDREEGHSPEAAEEPGGAQDRHQGAEEPEGARYRRQAGQAPRLR